MKKAALISFVCLLALGATFWIMAQPEDRRILPAIERILDSMKEDNSEPLPEMKNLSIVVKKKERKLFLFDAGKLVKTYNVGLGFTPVGDKEKEGDGKTPEGEFYIFTKNPNSSYYLSLGVSYPSIDDAKRGLAQKIISQTEHDAIVEAIENKKTPPQKTRLGGEIYIHGHGSKTDWTQGCVALDDADIKEIFDAIPVGASVKIEP
jgi:murein L,D-transpeptidase YafK